MKISKICSFRENKEKGKNKTRRQLRHFIFSLVLIFFYPLFINKGNVNLMGIVSKIKSYFFTSVCFITILKEPLIYKVVNLLRESSVCSN